MANPTSAKTSAPKKLSLAEAAARVRQAFPSETAGKTDYEVVDLYSKVDPAAWSKIEGDMLTGLGKGLLEGSGIGAFTGMDPIQPNEGVVGPTVGRLAGFAAPLLATGGAGALLKLPKAAQMAGLAATGAGVGAAGDVASQQEQAQRGVETPNPTRRALLAALAGGVGTVAPAYGGSGLLSRMVTGAGVNAPLGALQGAEDPEMGAKAGAASGALVGGVIGAASKVPSAVAAWRGRMAPAVPAPDAASIPAAEILKATSPQRPTPGLNEQVMISPLAEMAAPQGNPTKRALLHALLEDRLPSQRPEDVLSRIDYLENAIPVDLPQGQFQMAGKLKSPEDVRAMGGRYFMAGPEGDIRMMKQRDLAQGTKTVPFGDRGVPVPPGWDISFRTPLHQMGNQEYGVVATQGRLKSDSLDSLRAMLASGRAGHVAEMPGQDVPALVKMIQAQEQAEAARTASREALAGGKRAVSGAEGLSPPLQELDTLRQLEEIVREINKRRSGHQPSLPF